MNLLEDLRMPLLNFHFVMIYTTHKMLALLKTHLNFIKNNIFECFFFKKIIFFITYKDKKSKP